MWSMQGGDEEASGDEVENITIGQLLAEEMNRELRGDLYELEFNYTNYCYNDISQYRNDTFLEMGIR